MTYDVIQRVTPAIHLFCRIDKDILCHIKARKSSINTACLAKTALFCPERCIFYHQQINIRSIMCLAARSRAEKNDPLRVDLPDDALRHLVDYGVIYRCHGFALFAAWLERSSSR